MVFVGAAVQYVQPRPEKNETANRVLPASSRALGDDKARTLLPAPEALEHLVKMCDT
jgi:hypothetical protein